MNDKMFDETPAAADLCVPRRYGRVIWGVSLASFAIILLMAVTGNWVAYGAVPLLVAALCLGILLSAHLDSGRWLMHPPLWAWLVGVLALALLVRLSCVLFLPYVPCADFAVYHQSGATMAETWTLGVEAARPTYRCFYAPGQVFSLGVMYALFGRDVLAGQMLNVVYATLTVLGIWFITRRLFGDKAARVASLLAAFFPSTIFGCMLLGAEVPEAFWLVAAMCFYVSLLDRRGWMWAALACGVCLGVGALIRATYVLIPIPIGLHLLLSRPHKRRALLAAVLMGLGVAMVVLPWTYRNYRVTGGFILISSNGGGNLYSANNDNAQGAYTEEVWVYLFENCHDDLSLQKVGRRLALEWIRRNPRRFAELAAIKFHRFWFSDREIAWWALEQPRAEHPEQAVPQSWSRLARNVSDGYYIACLTACTVALWTRRKRLWSDSAWMFLPVLCIYFTAVHMVFESQGKYHYMLVPLLCILASLAVVGGSGTLQGTPARRLRASGVGPK